MFERNETKRKFNVFLYTFCNKLGVKINYYPCIGEMIWGIDWTKPDGEFPKLHKKIEDLHKQINELRKENELLLDYLKLELFNGKEIRKKLSTRN